MKRCEHEDDQTQCDDNDKKFMASVRDSDVCSWCRKDILGRENRAVCAYPVAYPKE